MTAIDVATGAWNGWGAPVRPSPADIAVDLTVEGHGWHISGRTYDTIFDGIVSTNGDGHWRQYLGKAQGREVWESVYGPDVPGSARGYFVYWNGSKYIEYVYLPNTPESIERLRSGDMTWICDPQMLAQRDNLARLMTITKDVVLVAPRPYSEIGGANGNHKGPWYTSLPMYAWLIFGTLVWVIGATSINSASSSGPPSGSSPSDGTGLQTSIGAAFVFLGVWLWYLCAFTAAMFRVNATAAKIITVGILAGMVKHSFDNRATERDFQNGK